MDRPIRREHHPYAYRDKCEEYMDHLEKENKLLKEVTAELNEHATTYERSAVNLAQKNKVLLEAMEVANNMCKSIQSDIFKSLTKYKMHPLFASVASVVSDAINKSKGGTNEG